MLDHKTRTILNAVIAEPGGTHPLVFSIGGMPAFVDRNGNGVWDGGRLVPYEPPEPIRWLDEPVRVRARWDTEVEAGDLVIGRSGN